MNVFEVIGGLCVIANLFLTIALTTVVAIELRSKPSNYIKSRFENPFTTILLAIAVIVTTYCGIGEFGNNISNIIGGLIVDFGVVSFVGWINYISDKENITDGLGTFKSLDGNYYSLDGYNGYYGKRDDVLQEAIKKRLESKRISEWTKEEKLEVTSGRNNISAKIVEEYWDAFYDESDEIMPGWNSLDKQLDEMEYDPEFVDDEVTKPIKLGTIPRRKVTNMRDEINRKVLLDLFASTTTLLPIVLGLTGLLFSWPMGSGTLAGLGLMAVMGGLGAFFTKVIFGLERIKDKAIQDILNENETILNAELDELDIRLRQDKDPRPEDCLRSLRSLRAHLKTNLNAKYLSKDIQENFEKLFNACVAHIKESDALWRAAKRSTQATMMMGKLPESVRKELKEKREKLVAEVQTATEKLVQYVNQYSEVKKQETVDNQSDIASSLKELEISIAVAKKVEERLNFTKSDYKEFEEN